MVKHLPIPDATALVALALGRLLILILVGARTRCALMGCKRCQAFLAAPPDSPRAAARDNSQQPVTNRIDNGGVLL